jgi:hypothetical protein
LTESAIRVYGSAAVVKPRRGATVTIFIVGIVLMVAGPVISWYGWRMHSARTRGGPADPFFKWFLEAVKKAYPVLTGPGHTGGERIAAFGSVVFALGVLVTIVGLVAWAGA